MATANNQQSRLEILEERMARWEMKAALKSELQAEMKAEKQRALEKKIELLSAQRQIDLLTIRAELDKREREMKDMHRDMKERELRSQLELERKDIAT